MRGFGYTLDTQTGVVRSWYSREDGVRRWADTTELVEPESRRDDDDNEGEDKMSKHTPGPWTSRPNSCCVTLPDGGVLVALTYGYCKGSGEDEDYATARLIAAAPDLLGAAIETMQTMGNVWGIDGRDDEYIYDEMGSDLSASYFALRAAIAKAVTS